MKKRKEAKGGREGKMAEEEEEERERLRDDKKSN